GRLDHHRRQPDHGLRQCSANPHHQLQRLRQRRYCRQPEHTTDLGHRRHRRQPSGQLCHHRQRRGRSQLHDYLRQRHPYDHPARPPSPPPASPTPPDNQPMVSGGALPPLPPTYSGFVNGDTAASLTTQPPLAPPATASSPVGSYAITASGAVDPNYTITYVNG